MSRLAYEEWAAAHRERDYMTTYRLIYAIDNNHEEAKKLLESGAEINVVPPILDDPTDYYHYTSTPDPLMDFILRSHYIPGHSPLHHAAATGNARAATLLLQHGADGSRAALRNKVANPNLRDYIEATPLHAAARHNHPELMQLLIDHGADESAKDCCGWTPADYLRHYHKQPRNH